MEEMLEIWDWDSALPTGKKISRSIAHSKGIPHQSVHLWIIRTDYRQPEILFQFRSAHKENYPRCLDITVGGHVPFGYRGNPIIKEAREEIGIDPDADDLINLGCYRYEERNDSIFQREFQHVYLLLDNRPLHTYRFIDGEVSAICAVPMVSLKELLLKNTSASVEMYNGDETYSAIVERKDFHPQLFDSSMKCYMEIFIQALQEYVEDGIVSVTMSP